MFGKCYHYSFTLAVVELPLILILKSGKLSLTKARCSVEMAGDNCVNSGTKQAFQRRPIILMKLSSSTIPISNFVMSDPVGYLPVRWECALMLVMGIKSR